jgi:hypothetical protein
MARGRLSKAMAEARQTAPWHVSKHPGQHRRSATNTLATRQRELEQAGLITRRRYSEHPPRDEYLLTRADSTIGPVLRELQIWGETYARCPRRGNACIRWVAQFLDEGPAGLTDQSSRPQPRNNPRAPSIMNGRLSQFGRR